MTVNRAYTLPMARGTGIFVTPKFDRGFSMLRIVLAGCAAFLLAQSALADDSSAALGAGGLVLTQSTDIRMAVEDLKLSPNRAVVRYEFVNDGPKDIDSIVA